MIMESRRGKGMHDKKERAALLLKQSSKFPLSALASPKTQEPERFFSPPVAQGLGPFFFVPTLVRTKGRLRTRSRAGLLDQDYVSQ